MTSAAVASMNPPPYEIANFLNLVIVDDERMVREACRDAARAQGFNVLLADSAEHAYRLLDSQAVDVVLLDLKSPGVGGLEVLQRIRQRRPDAEVIVVTGCATVQSAVQAMKYGAYDYVTKPFSMDELRLLLERVAAHLKLKTENRMLREKTCSSRPPSGAPGARFGSTRPGCATSSAGAVDRSSSPATPSVPRWQ